MSRRRRFLLGGAAAVGIAAGAAGIAGAATGNTPFSESDGPAYTSSVTVPGGEADGNSSPDLQSLAKVTADQARGAATAAVPGTAGAPHLDNDDGNVVWIVPVTGADGKVTDVTIDAGNATVLAKEAAEAKDDGTEERDGADTEPNGSETPDGASTSPSAPAPTSSSSTSSSSTSSSSTSSSTPGASTPASS